jgi:hypothetical protein
MNKKTMERRNVIKSVLFSTVGLISLPAWGNNWNLGKIIGSKNIFSETETQILDILVDALIPSGTIIGAKDIGTSTFINRMSSDCYDKDAQESFKKGLENSVVMAKQLFNKSLSECEHLQKTELLKNMSVASNISQKEFFNQLKSFTVLAYTTSEYVLTNHYNYVMAPGHYYGCVNV